MTCEQIKEILPLYHYGELTPDETGSVEEHMKSCSECSTVLADIKTTLKTLNPPELPDIHDSFWQDNAARIICYLKNNVNQTSPRAEAANIWFAFRIAAAAAILVMAILIGTEQPGTTQTEPNLIGITKYEEAKHQIRSIEYEISSFWLNKENFGIAGIDDSLNNISMDITYVFADNAEGDMEGFDHSFSRSLDTLKVQIDDLSFDMMQFGKGGEG